MNPSSQADCCVLYDSRSQQWLYFESPIEVISSSDISSLKQTLENIETRVETESIYAVGFISYEASPAFNTAFTVRPSSSKLPFLWFGLYKNPTVIELPRVSAPTYGTPEWNIDIGETAYSGAIKQIKNYIRNGDSYQVNYTYRVTCEFKQNSWQFFLKLIQAQGRGYGAYINTPGWTICSASPELFFMRSGKQLVSNPMKGTVRRGLGFLGDIARKNWLQTSEKNQAENLMIVDMVRNDMSQIADLGSVDVTNLFSIEKYPTLWQMVSTVQCTTSASTADVFQAMFPASSIVGAPKVRTMQIIAQLENSARGLYTGAIGYIAPNNQAQFNVAIRSVVINNASDTAIYGSGGGIVWDSSIDEELNESRLKTRILTYDAPDFELLETILWTPKDSYYLLNEHLLRLSQSAEYFSFDIDLNAIRCALKNEESQLAQTSQQPHKVRLLVTQHGDFSTDFKLLNQHSGNYSASLAKTPVQANTNWFLYHKTSNRKVYENAMAQSTDVDDVILWNEDGYITESCIANIVVEIDEQLVTPPVSSGLLPGIYRQHLLDQEIIKEAQISVEELKKAGKVYLINSVRKMWQIDVLGSEYQG
ncbi:MAG: bifunctional anthranilate synthase component I family protein/class IV aminotransferase [Pseudomonadales bacterium]|nr:bifunctional anthranilate synthase component I family protein/class IV aminotransferase [Pseudomonadales bacterium]